MSVERLSQDVLELFAHLKVKSAHVIANSAGGYVAQKLAMRAPECVKSLMLYGSTPGLKKSGTDAWIPLIEKEGLGNFLARTIADRFPLDRVDPALVKWFLQETSKCDQRFICRWLGVMTALDMSDELHKIVCPTLIVRAGGETVGGADHYDVMLERIGDAEMLTYAGLPHNICDIVPQRCIQDALAFLDRRFPAS